MKYPRTLLLMLASALLMLSACSRGGESDVLSTIPGESACVVRFDINALLSNAGCTLNDGVWQQSDALRALTDQSTSRSRFIMRGLLAIAPVVEDGHVYGYLYGGKPYLTCSLKHADAVADELEKELGRPEKKDGFKVFDGNIFMRDNRLWVADDAEGLVKSLDAADDEPASASKPMQALGSDNGSTAVVVLNNRRLLDSMPYLAHGIGSVESVNDSYDVYEMKLDGAKLHADCKRYDADGEIMKTSTVLSKIDDSFCSLVPKSSLLVFALGKPGEELLGSILKNMPPQALQAAEPWLKAWNGTVSLALAPPADVSRLLHPEAYRVMLTVQYDEAKANEAIGFFTSNMPYSNEGQWKMFDANGIRFGLTYTDGMLVASTFGTDEPGGIDASKFDFYSAGYFDLDSKGDVATAVGLPFGIKISGNATDTEAIMDLALTDSEHPLLETLLILITDRQLQRRMAEKVASLER